MTVECAMLFSQSGIPGYDRITTKVLSFRPHIKCGETNDHAYELQHIYVNEDIKVKQPQDEVQSSMQQESVIIMESAFH